MPENIKPLSRKRFDALAAYTREPATVLYVEDVEWHATRDERLIGLILLDRTDRDYGWGILGRDERHRFRAIDVNTSLPDLDAARAQLFLKMAEHYALPDDSYHQGDAPDPPTDFFTPLVPDDRLHPNFKILTTAERYTPARELIEAMMHFYQDTDGNFVEQFQTSAFDARLWELYLYAAFTELGYAPEKDIVVPDFLFTSPFGAIGIEATSINPPQDGAIQPPKNREEFVAYLENYIPIKMARVLRRKLNKNQPYWERPEMQGVPFVIAVQDYHLPGAMRMIIPAMTEYTFGVRHSMEGGKIRIERIAEHTWNDIREASGFFRLDNAKNVSAIIVNPQGTLVKFNRLGFLAEFGNRNVQMVRTGYVCNDADPENQHPTPFRQLVHEPGYDESWVEGMLVLHNPNARIPLEPPLVPGARHEFLQPDGNIISIVPPFHPLFSETQITVAA